MELLTMNTCGFELQHDSFAALVQTVEGTTSLVTLRLIDNTVDALGSIRSTFSGLALQARTLAESVKDLRPLPDRYLDEKGAMVARLKACADDLECHRDDFRDRRSAIDDDDELQPHHCDMLHSSYEEADRSAEQLLQAMEDLRSAVIDFDYRVRRTETLVHNVRAESFENFKKLEEADVFDIDSAYEAFVTNRQR